MDSPLDSMASLPICLRWLSTKSIASSRFVHDLCFSLSLFSSPLSLTDAFFCSQMKMVDADMDSFWVSRIPRRSQEEISSLTSMFPSSLLASLRSQSEVSAQFLPCTIRSAIKAPLYRSLYEHHMALGNYLNLHAASAYDRRFAMEHPDEALAFHLFVGDVPAMPLG